MNIEEFIQMLHKAEIQKEILRIVKDGQSGIFDDASDKEAANNYIANNAPRPFVSDEFSPSQTADGNEKEKIRILEGENARLKEEVLEMRNKLKQAQIACNNAKNHIQDIESELKGCQRQIINLNGALNEYKQSIHDLQDENAKWSNAYETEKQKSSMLSLKFQNEVEALKQENQRLEQRKNSIEKANKSLQYQLEQRFSRGWELFETYQNVEAHTKQLLHNGVFTQETNFMSFICGGAQISSLEKLWEALRECIMYGQQKDAEILWEIFEYCIELVNSSKTQAKYEILSVNEGDRFDPDIHTEGPNSMAQGKVLNVYLPGYQNTYNGKIIKKSIVQVG